LQEPAAAGRPGLKRLPAPTPEKGTVAICFVAAAVEHVARQGLDVESVLLRSGISPSLLGTPQARVSAANYAELWRLVAQVLDDEFFGQDSRRMKCGSFAMLCRTVVHTDTLRQGLDRTLRFFRLLLDDIEGVLGSEGASATVTLRTRASTAAPRMFAHEALLIMIHGVACWLVGRRIPITAAAFAYPEPAHSAEYRVMYSTQLYFSQPQTRISFDATYLDLPVVQNERSLKEFLRVAPQNILIKYKNANSMAAKIRRRLRQLLPGELPEFDALAAELNMTPITLRRRLQDEGESYQSLKDQLRRDLAITYMSHTQRSVRDIALELGFAEPSAFHRAFKKWTGTAPGEYRRSFLSPPP
jgi:AraC-like DNA-binding protein